MWHGDLVPSGYFAEFVRDLIARTETINPRLRAAAKMDKPNTVFYSVLENGKVALLNFNGKPATIKLASGRIVTMGPYEPMMVE